MSHDLSTLDALPDVFSAFPGPWWVAGGWAADLHVGRLLRPHADLDVLILHDHLDAFAETFTDREITRKNLRDGAAHPWTPATEVDPAAHTLLFSDPRLPFPIEVTVSRSEGDEWIFHRGSGRIRRKLSLLTQHTPEGLPYLGPEVVLLFKSRQDRPKDHDDFAALAPHLTPEQAAWLLPWVNPPGRGEHPWTAALREACRIEAAPDRL